MPKNDSDFTNRTLIFTPTLGLVRMEWVVGRYGQIIPCNWSNVELQQFCSAYIPLEYQLADAQNMMAKKVVEMDMEWVIYIEDDNVVPADLFIRFNRYMISNKVPVVSGLYFTKSSPPEPLIYRESGRGYYTDWKLGDKVWAAGIPFGCRLESASLIKAAWKESEEYRVGDIITRRIFKQPERLWWNKERGGYQAVKGTTNLAWCKRIMDDKLFEKAGWPKYQKMKYPFLVDTNIFVWHIDRDGRQYPLAIPKEYQPKNDNKKITKRSVA